MSVTTTPTTETAGVRAAGPVIVVGYDGSPEARLAVAVAGERAGPDGTVVPVHATDVHQVWVGAPLHWTAVEWAAEGERRLVAEMADIDVGFAATEPEVIEGDPALALLRVARDRNAREIVVGSRGRGRIRSLLGSVSRRVLAEADRPVVVVPRAALPAED